MCGFFGLGWKWGSWVGAGRRVITTGYGASFLGDKNVLKSMVVKVAHICEYCKNHSPEHFELMNCMACEFLISQYNCYNNQKSKQVINTVPFFLPRAFVYLSQGRGQRPSMGPSRDPPSTPLSPRPPKHPLPSMLLCAPRSFSDRRVFISHHPLPGSLSSFTAQGPDPHTSSPRTRGFLLGFLGLCSCGVRLWSRLLLRHNFLETPRTQSWNKLGAQ